MTKDCISGFQVENTVVFRAGTNNEYGENNATVDQPLFRTYKRNE